MVEARFWVQLQPAPSETKPRLTYGTARDFLDHRQSRRDGVLSGDDCDTRYHPLESISLTPKQPGVQIMLESKGETDDLTLGGTDGYFPYDNYNPSFEM